MNGVKAPLDYRSLEDDTLIRLVAVGKAEAFSALYDRYAKVIFSLAFNIVGDELLAEEITQDVYIKVWERACSYRSELGKFFTWIASITRYRAIDLLRHLNLRPEGHCISWAGIEVLDLPDRAAVESDIELSQLQQMVRWALSQLPTEQRQVLALSYFRGLSHQEIAIELNKPLGTVKTRIHIGMQRLRQLLESVN